MIRTKRLHIRPLNYYETICRVYSHTGMVTDDEKENNFVQYSITPMSTASEEDIKWYTIWDAEFEGERVLECGFICPPTEHKLVEVWVYASPKHMNRGYGTEAVSGLLKFASAYGVKWACATVDKDNKASQRMLSKSGFNYLDDAPNGMMVFLTRINN